MGRFRYVRPLRPTRVPMVIRGTPPAGTPARHWLDRHEAEQDERAERLQAQTARDNDPPTPPTIRS
jgi:hypothetical protein